MYKYVFFDLDGTILDTLGDLAAAGNYALAVQGFPVHEKERYRYFAGNGIPKLIERILPENSSDELKIRTRKLFSEYYAVHDVDETRPYDGISELIDRLSEIGIKCAVITNKDDLYAKSLVRRFFGGKISAVYGSKDGFPRKPDPYWANVCLSDIGAEKSEVLYVGDSGVDMELSKNAGFTGCGVLWGFRDKKELIENGADYICEKPSEILDIILNLQ